MASLRAADALWALPSNITFQGHSWTGSWRYHPGDDPAWRDPAWDDSAWPAGSSAEVPLGRTKLPWSGLGWFRLKIEVPRLARVDAHSWTSPRRGPPNIGSTAGASRCSAPSARTRPDQRVRLHLRSDPRGFCLRLSGQIRPQGQGPARCLHRPRSTRAGVDPDPREPATRRILPWPEAPEGLPGLTDPSGRPAPGGFTNRR